MIRSIRKYNDSLEATDSLDVWSLLWLCYYCYLYQM